jgi:hypothetical protein
MKKLTGVIILAGLLMIFKLAGYADSSVGLFYNNNTYTIEQASLPQSGFPFIVSQKDGVIEFSDKASSFTVSIKYNVLDDASFGMLRQYYNDSDSSKDDLFGKFLDLQKSYIPAMQELYNMSFLYGDAASPVSQSNMKLFYEKQDSMFSHPADVFLYNVIKSENLSVNEETHLDIIVPVPSQYSLISINIITRSGSLNTALMDNISTITGCLRFTGLPSQTTKLDVFNDKNIIDAVNAGIYPVMNKKAVKFSELADEQAGYKLLYPSSFLPYMENSIGGKLLFKSFKITPNHIFSISVQPVEKGTELDGEISFIKEAGKTSIKIKEEGKTNISGKKFSFLKYDLKIGNYVQHVQDYLITNGTMLYRFQLSSLLEEPSAAISGEFLKILASLDFTILQNKTVSDEDVFTRYENIEEGYCFDYPKAWQLDDISNDINFDKLKIEYQDLSGPIDIYVAEGSIYQGCNPEEIINGLTGQSDRYIKKYDPPYAGTVKKVLDISYSIKDSIIYLYKLINYEDSNGRSRLCYSADIIKDGKIYSIFITVGGYLTKDGIYTDNDVNNLLNSIASSFKLETTKESTARKAVGETRNRKVVFIEDSMKKKLDPALVVTSITAAGTDGVYYLTAGNSPQSGYYKIKLDYADKELQIEEKMLKSQIMKVELEKLNKIYSKRQITDVELNERNMTITISSRSSNTAPIVSRTYGIDINFTKKGVEWETVRNDHAEQLKKECKIYLDSFFLADVNVYFPSKDEFKDIETYRKTNCVYTTLIYAEFNQTSGFFTLEIDPVDDNIKFISYSPVDKLLTDIKLKCKYGENGYHVSDRNFNSDKFTMQLYLTSFSDGALSMESFKIWYNAETNNIESDKIK